MTDSTAIIVPARVASTRLPRKLLQPVHGRPLIVWTAERIRSQAPEYPLYFAVDGEALAEPLNRAGFETLLTSPDLPSGTDRVAAANRAIGARRVINVQADEPLVTGEQIRLLDSLLAEGVDMATLGVPLDDDESFHNPNQVKFVRARDGRALYFSRAPIPWIRDTDGRLEGGGHPPDSVLGHLGLYAYTADFLEAFSRMEPGVLETLERLEMLRALENGFTIAAGITPTRLIGVDTPEDLARFRNRVDGNPKEP